MYRIAVCTMLAAAAALHGPLAAQTSTPKDTTLQFSANAGYVQTGGNTRISTLNVGERIAWVVGRGRVDQSFSLVRGRADGVTNASLIQTDVRYTQSLSSRLGIFAVVAFDRNTFAGIARRFEEGAGLSFAAIRAPKDELNIESGFSLFQQTPTLEAGDGVTARFVAARTALAYTHTFSANARFSQRIETLPNLEVMDDLRINTESSLVAPISKELAVKLSYVIRFDNQPEDALAKTDRIFTSAIQLTL